MYFKILARVATCSIPGLLISTSRNVRSPCASGQGRPRQHVVIYLVLGFARFLGGSLAGSRAAGLSTDASGGLASKKKVTAHEDDRELDAPSPKKKRDQLQQETCVSGRVDTKNARLRERVASRFV